MNISPYRAPWAVRFTSTSHRTPSTDTVEYLNSQVRECVAQGNVEKLHVILSNEGMTSLRIQGPIDDAGWYTLRKAMPDGFLVEVLDLSNVNLGSSGGLLLFRALGRMPQLDVLTLNEVEAEEIVSTMDCPALAIKTLEVRACGEGVYPLLFKLCGNSSLTALNVSPWNLKDESSNALFKALQNNGTVARISLSDRPSSEVDELDLSMIAKIPSLRELELCSNNLSDTAVSRLLSSLTDNNTCLEHLNLKGNHFGPKAMTALAALLWCNSTLRMLSFDDCENRFFKEEELKLLVSALQENKSLLHLYVNPSFSERCGSSVMRLLMRNHKILDKGPDEGAGIRVAEDALTEPRGLLPQEFFSTNVDRTRVDEE
jgi:hypothetical protein